MDIPKFSPAAIEELNKIGERILKENAKNRLLDAVTEYVQCFWTKRVNPMYPEAGACYPGAVSEFVEIELDGEKHTFHLRIKDITELIGEFDKEWTL